MAEIDLSGVSCIYPGGAVGVRELDLRVAEGELLVLVGPSGSGKTTTLRLIAGLEQPTSGDVRIGGASVSKMSPAARDVALVSQHAALYPHLSVRDNLAFGMRMRKQGVGLRRWWRRIAHSQESAAIAAAIDAAVNDVAATLGLTLLLDRRATALSGGEQQRVALGRALVRQPKAWLLDEPLAHLDLPLKAELRRELKRIQNDARATMIYVTHDTAEAQALGDRIAVLRAGQLQQVGSWRDLYERPDNRFVAEFVSPAPLGVVTGTVDAGASAGATAPRFVAPGLVLPVDNVPSAGVQQQFGKRLAMGLRPEDVWLGGDAPPWPAACRVEVRIDWVEPRGDGVLAWLRPVAAPGEGSVDDAARGSLPPSLTDTLVAKVAGARSPHVAPRHGERMVAWLNLAQALWFDDETGRRVVA